MPSRPQPWEMGDSVFLHVLDELVLKYAERVSHLVQLPLNELLRTSLKVGLIISKLNAQQNGEGIYLIVDGEEHQISLFSDKYRPLYRETATVVRGEQKRAVSKVPVVIEDELKEIANEHARTVREVINEMIWVVCSCGEKQFEGIARIVIRDSDGDAEMMLLSSE